MHQFVGILLADLFSGNNQFSYAELKSAAAYSFLYLYLSKPEWTEGKRRSRLSKDEKLNFWLQNNWTEKYNNEQTKSYDVKNCADL